MRLAVPATRMELLKLRKRLKIAERGHRLLKDKLEELMNRVYKLVSEIQLLRSEVEKALQRATGLFNFAASMYRPSELELAVSYPTKRILIETETERILNVRVPKFKKVIEGRMVCYGPYFTSGDLDIALSELDKILDRMIELAEKEKALELIAEEIEKTRRRVNALEYVLIPSIRETISYITLKLSEMERGNLTRLMRVKEKIRG